jgi:hypothetical protein
MERITFYISSQIALHTARPYIDELKNRNLAIDFVIAENIKDHVNALIGPSDGLTLISEYRKKNYLARWAHSTFSLLFTPLTFSSMYKRYITEFLSKKTILIRVILYALLTVTPKLSTRQLHTIQAKLTRMLISFPLPNDKIIAISIAVEPYLLAGRGDGVYTVMESWDHPSKKPVGYCSRAVYVWNERLREEWRKYQQDKNILLAPPIKLLYATLTTHQFSGRGDVLMYPFSTSSVTPAKNQYREEVEFVKLLCLALKKCGLRLLIKPKPNTFCGELDFFLQYDNVEIGAYQNNSTGNHYDLSQHYNLNRLKELDKARLIITRGTTFAFDAALYGVPVLQLIFNAKKQFPALSNLVDYPHLAVHIFSVPQFLLSITDDQDVYQRLVETFFGISYIDVAVKYKEYIRSWLLPRESPKIKHVIDSIIC